MREEPHPSLHIEKPPPSMVLLSEIIYLFQCVMHVSYLVYLSIDIIKSVMLHDYIMLHQLQSEHNELQIKCRA